MAEFKGLTTDEARAILRERGPNKLVSKKPNFLKRLLIWIISPVSLMLLSVAVLSYVSGKKDDFWIIIVLYVLNFSISFWHEAKADRSIEKLQQLMTFKAKVFRDGSWTFIDSVGLAVGDVVELKVGAVVPADLDIIEAKNLSCNESALSGESLPKQKNAGDKAFSGSFISTGYAVGAVFATGAGTEFGKTVSLVDSSTRRSALEKDILSVSKFLSVISLAVVVVLSALFAYDKAPLSDIFTLDLSLLIAGVPVALPTVMSLIISVGVFELAKKSVVVRRMSSLEDLANVDLLLSDKTGTLTENKIRAEKIIPFGEYGEREVLKLAASAAVDPETSPFDRAVFEKAEAEGVSGYPRSDFIPGDSERKRSTAIVSISGTAATVSLGTPHIIESLCVFGGEGRRLFEQTVRDAAARGYRAFAVAVNQNGGEEKNMVCAGILLLADTVRADAADTLEFLKEQGIAVKMITGDNYDISKEVAKKLGFAGEMLERSALDGNANELEKRFDSAAGFSQVLPRDKYSIVGLARKNHTVAMTGDGVNDLPAVKAADVGFAVKNAVDALKSSADIVLLADGISVIKDAIIEARKIFVRLYNYSVYRVSESFRVIITIAVIGFLYRMYPLTPLQLIILALLNDVPILSMAFDAVKNLSRPAHIDPRRRFAASMLYGLVGVANSLILFFAMTNWLHVPWNQIQTVFFLKLVVSGHMLVYVAHTEDRWYRFLPSIQVIIATLATGFAATALALDGIFTVAIPLSLVVLVWVWSFCWMQVSELMKDVRNYFENSRLFKSRPFGGTIHI